MVTRFGTGFAIFALFLAPSAGAGPNPIESVSDGSFFNRFVLGTAAGWERFDSNIRLTNKDKDWTIFLDGEGSLALPTTEFAPIVYGAVNINSRHGFGFNFFKVNRVGNTQLVDADFEDINITGLVEFSDRTGFYYVSYSYALVQAETGVVRALVGLYGVDLKFELNAVGDISIDDESVISGQYQESFEEFVPAPLLGLDFWFRAAERWALGARFATIAGSFGDVSALVTEAQIRVHYDISDWLGLILGVNYLSADVDINDSDKREEIRYGYDGAYIGLHAMF